MEKLGYEKEIDWVEFRLTIQAVPEKAMRLNEVIKQKRAESARRTGLKHRLFRLKFALTFALLPMAGLTGVSVQRCSVDTLTAVNLSVARNGPLGSSAENSSCQVGENHEQP